MEWPFVTAETHNRVRKHVTALEDNLDTQRAKYETVQKENEALREALKDARAEQKKLSDGLSEVGDRFNKKEGDLTAATRKLKDTETLLANAQKRKDVVANDVRNLLDEINEKTLIIAALQEKLDNVTRIVEEMEKSKLVIEVVETPASKKPRKPRKKKEWIAPVVTEVPVEEAPVIPTPSPAVEVSASLEQVSKELSSPKGVLMAKPKKDEKLPFNESESFKPVDKSTPAPKFVPKLTPKAPRKRGPGFGR